MLQGLMSLEKVDFLPARLPRDGQDKSQCCVLWIPTGFLGFNSLEPWEVEGILSPFVLLILGVGEWYLEGWDPQSSTAGVQPRHTGTENKRRMKRVLTLWMEDLGRLIFNPTPTPAPRVQMRVFVVFRIYASVMFRQCLYSFLTQGGFFCPSYSVCFSLLWPLLKSEPRSAGKYCHSDFSLLLSLPILPTACQASYQSQLS